MFLLLLPPSHAFAQNSLPTGEFKISTDVDLVLLDVSVKAAKGGYVSGLSKDNFLIYENGAAVFRKLFRSRMTSGCSAWPFQKMPHKAEPLCMMPSRSRSTI